MVQIKLINVYSSILIALFSVVTVNGSFQRIIGGCAAKESQFPYQVSVRRNALHVCGGVIISRNYILTAGRCVVKNIAPDGIVSYSPHNLNVRVGSLSLYEQGLLVQVAQVTLHSNYSNMLNDLAILKFEEPLIYSDYIRPVSLPCDTPAIASLVDVAGWGHNKLTDDLSRHLLYLQMEVVDPSNCLSDLWGEEADQSLLCLQAHPVEEGGICTGDIGGLAVQNGVLVGLASFALERCGSEYPDGFTNIAHYIEWIRDNTDVE